MQSEPELDDAEVRRLQRGDVGALELAYLRFGERVLATCRGLLGNAADAEDAAQDVFIKLFERAHQFDRRSRFSTWLYRLSVNHCLHMHDKLRLRRGNPLPVDATDELVAATGSPLEAAQESDARTLLDRRLMELSPEHRAVLVLREIDALPYEEIANVLEVPVGTVMSRLARARERWVQVTRAATAVRATVEVKT